MATKTETKPKRKYTKRPKEQEAAPRSNPATENVFSVDEATWTRILQAAAQGQISPVDVMKQSVVNAYGGQSPEGAWHSGQSNDPSLKK